MTTYESLLYGRFSSLLNLHLVLLYGEDVKVKPYRNMPWSQISQFLIDADRKMRKVRRLLFQTPPRIDASSATPGADGVLLGHLAGQG